MFYNISQTIVNNQIINLSSDEEDEVNEVIYINSMEGKEEKNQKVQEEKAEKAEVEEREKQVLEIEEVDDQGKIGQENVKMVSDVCKEDEDKYNKKQPTGYSECMYTYFVNVCGVTALWQYVSYKHLNVDYVLTLYLLTSIFEE